MRSLRRSRKPGPAGTASALIRPADAGGPGTPGILDEPVEDPDRAVDGPVLRAIRVAFATNRNTRRRNEDAAGIGGWSLQGELPVTLDVVSAVSADSTLAVALADGLGGQPSGDLAARIAVKVLTGLGPGDGQSGLDALIHARFAAANRAVHAGAVDGSEGMGCTAVLLVVDRWGRAGVGNVGDVRAYRIASGFAGELTVDDRPQGEERPSGLVLACLGGRTRSQVEPHIHEAQLRPGDRIVLCSDGVHDVLSEPEIGQLGDADTVRSAADLITAAVAAGSQDNVTVAVVDGLG